MIRKKPPSDNKMSATQAVNKYMKPLFYIHV